MRLAGIDVSIDHSVRAASAFAAAGGGLTLDNIVQTADWSCESVLQKFYY